MLQGSMERNKSATKGSALQAGRPSDSPVSALFTKTPQADTSALGSLKCTIKGSCVRRYLCKNASTSLSHFCVPSGTGGKRYGSKLRKSSDCCWGSAKKRSQIIRGNTEKSSTSRSSHMDIMPARCAVPSESPPPHRRWH